ncbi:MAG: type II toxin-antitoxin system VapC family toxin [Symploca sp. SIO2E6]|nr:type II toxin-antitoxin system VapC family toxin [Symploca sp. SIO2E6]
MVYILDTDHLSLFQREHPLLTERVKATDPQTIAVTIITLEEQVYGRLNKIRRATSTESLVLAYAKLRYTWDFFSTINLLSFTQEASDCYAALVSQKIRIGTQDLKIAAIALSLKGIVVTRNQRDFCRVPGLELADWTVGELQR